MLQLTISRRMYFQIIILIFLFFTGCGITNEDESKATKTIKGQFIDDKVQGLNYSCSSGLKGVTDSNGNYTCKIGDDVTFKIGNTVIGTLAAQRDFFTPYSFFPSSREASLNLASLLQSVDSDGDKSNGIIVIDNSLVIQLSSNILFTSPTFRTDIKKDLGIELIPEDQAV